LGVDQYEDDTLEPRDIPQVQRRGSVDVFEQMLTVANGDRGEQQVELVNDPRLRQRDIEKTIAVLDDVAPGPLYQVLNERSHISIDNGGIPRCL
jgi:hypothetical protein